MSNPNNDNGVMESTFGDPTHIKKGESNPYGTIVRSIEIPTKEKRNNALLIVLLVCVGCIPGAQFFWIFACFLVCTDVLDECGPCIKFALYMMAGVCSMCCCIFLVLITVLVILTLTL